MEIINVSLKKEIEDLSYPIFVGNNILTKADSPLKKYIENKKIIIIHDNFFSYKSELNNTFIDFVKLIQSTSLSVDLISVSGGDQTKNMLQLTDILEQALSYELIENVS